MKKWLIVVGGAWLFCVVVIGATSPSGPANTSRASLKNVVDVPAAYAAVPTPTFYPITLRSKHPTPTPVPVSP
jgi:hypothetical protein